MPGSTQKCLRQSVIAQGLLPLGKGQEASGFNVVCAIGADGTGTADFGSAFLTGDFFAAGFLTAGFSAGASLAATSSAMGSVTISFAAAAFLAGAFVGVAFLAAGFFAVAIVFSSIML